MVRGLEMRKTMILVPALGRRGTWVAGPRQAHSWVPIPLPGRGGGLEGCSPCPKVDENGSLLGRPKPQHWVKKKKKNNTRFPEHFL